MAAILSRPQCVKDAIHIFASISKIMCILLMGRYNRERCICMIWCQNSAVCEITEIGYCLLFESCHIKVLMLTWLWAFNNSSGVIWQHRTRSTLAQVMACCLVAPSHYLNQCWLVISVVHSSESNFTRETSAINQQIAWKLLTQVFFRHGQ